MVVSLAVLLLAALPLRVGPVSFRPVRGRLAAGPGLVPGFGRGPERLGRADVRGGVIVFGLPAVAQPLRRLARSAALLAASELLLAAGLLLATELLLAAGPLLGTRPALLAGGRALLAALLSRGRALLPALLSRGRSLLTSLLSRGRSLLTALGAPLPAGWLALARRSKRLSRRLRLSPAGLALWRLPGLVAL